MLRKAFQAVLILAALGALGLTATWVLGSFRARGDISLRPREKAGRTFSVSETLSHGEREEAVRWAGDYVEEILEVREGRPSRVRRSYVSALMDHTGPPAPKPLDAVVLLDDAGVREEASGEPFARALVSWPDPFSDLLPARPVHNYSEWTLPAGAAARAASFLARETVRAARGEAKLEPEETREGLPMRRVRVALEADLEDARTLRAWADLFVAPGGLLLDVQWLGTIDGKKGEIRLDYLRKRQPRK
ncbi:MAG: hypothetical protein HUU15_07340 [Candidatus Brocadiae bacterium]|nr:hypothetical protein [Candidatus Brocadiia bacterium]